MASRGGTHLLLGPELGEKDLWVDALVQRIAEETGSKPEIQRFYLSDGDLGVFLDGLRTGDLFAAHRVALITDVTDLGKADGERLAAYLAAPSPEVTLILQSTSVSLPARDASGKATQGVPGSNRKIFWELFANQKLAFVEKFFASRKMRIEGEAAEYLLEVVESNTRELRLECEKLALLHRAGDIIESETIELYVYHSKEESAFTLFDRVALRELEGSLEVLNKILLSSSSEGGGLLGALVSQFRRLLELKLMSAGGMSIEQAIEGAHIRGRRNQQSFRAAAQAYTLEEVRAVIALTASTEVRLRSSRSDLQGLILSLYLYDVIARGGRVGGRHGHPRTPAPRPRRPAPAR